MTAHRVAIRDRFGFSDADVAKVNDAVCEEYEKKLLFSVFDDSTVLSNLSVFRIEKTGITLHNYGESPTGEYLFELDPDSVTHSVVTRHTNLMHMQYVARRLIMECMRFTGIKHVQTLLTDYPSLIWVFAVSLRTQVHEAYTTMGSIGNKDQAGLRRMIQACIEEEARIHAVPINEMVAAGTSGSYLNMLISKSKLSVCHITESHTPHHPYIHVMISWDKNSEPLHIVLGDALEAGFLSEPHLPMNPRSSRWRLILNEVNRMRSGVFPLHSALVPLMGEYMEHLPIQTGIKVSTPRSLRVTLPGSKPTQLISEYGQHCLPWVAADIEMVCLATVIAGAPRSPYGDFSESLPHPAIPLSTVYSQDADTDGFQAQCMQFEVVDGCVYVWHEIVLPRLGTRYVRRCVFTPQDCPSDVVYQNAAHAVNTFMLRQLENNAHLSRGGLFGDVIMVGSERINVDTLALCNDHGVREAVLAAKVCDVPLSWLQQYLYSAHPTLLEQSPGNPLQFRHAGGRPGDFEKFTDNAFEVFCNGAMDKLRPLRYIFDSDFANRVAHFGPACVPGATLPPTLDAIVSDLLYGTETGETTRSVLQNFVTNHLVKVCGDAHALCTATTFDALSNKIVDFLRSRAGVRAKKTLSDTQDALWDTAEKITATESFKRELFTIAPEVMKKMKNKPSIVACEEPGRSYKYVGDTFTKSEFLILFFSGPFARVVLRAYAGEPSLHMYGDEDVSASTFLCAALPITAAFHTMYLFQMCCDVSHTAHQVVDGMLPYADPAFRPRSPTCPTAMIVNSIQNDVEVEPQARAWVQMLRSAVTKANTLQKIEDLVHQSRALGEPHMVCIFYDLYKESVYNAVLELRNKGFVVGLDDNLHNMVYSHGKCSAVPGMAVLRKMFDTLAILLGYCFGFWLLTHHSPLFVAEIMGVGAAETMVNFAINNPDEFTKYVRILFLSNFVQWDPIQIINTLLENSTI